MRVEKKHVISIGILAMLVVGPYMPAILGFVRMVGPDLVNQFIPWKTFVVEQLRQGNLPLWRPETFSGTPIFADIQAAIFYPFDWLAVVIPLEIFFPISYAFHGLMTAVAMYIWIYRKTASVQGAFLSGLVWSWCGFTATNIVAGFVGTAIAPSYLPLLLIVVDLLIEKRRVFFLICLILTFSMQLLSGHPQPVVFSFYFLLAYVIWRAFLLYRHQEMDWKSGLILIACVPLSILGMALVSAVSSLPLMELAGFSAGRSGGVSYEFATTDSLPFYGLALVLSPFLFGSPMDGSFSMTSTGYHEICGYLGILPLFLAMLALRRRRDRPFLLAMSVLSLLFALGSNTPMFKVLYHAAPGFKWFRVPARFLMLWSFSVAALAGMGTADLLQSRHRRLPMGTVVSCGLLVLVLIGLFGFSINVSQEISRYFSENEPAAQSSLSEGKTSLNDPSGDTYSEASERALEKVGFMVKGSQKSLLLGLLSIVLIALIRGKERFLHVGLLAGLVLLIADPGFFNVKVKPYVETEEYDLKVYRESRIIKMLREDGFLFRALSTDDAIGVEKGARHPELFPERPSIYGIQTVRGYNPTILKHYAEYINVMNEVGREEDVRGQLLLPDATRMNRRMLNELNVKYVMTYNKVPKDFKRVLTDMDLVVYENPQVYPRAYVSRKDTLTKDPVTITEYLPNRVKVQASVSSPGTLVLADVWYPGWTATVDGQKSAIEPYHGVFRGVKLTKGDHEVVFSFRPKTFVVGLMTSVLSALALCAALLWLRDKKIPWTG